MLETAALAAFAASLTFEKLPQDVVHAAKRILLDTLGTSLAATTLDEGCTHLLALARAATGSSDASVISRSERVPALTAALVNGGLGHALNYDAGGSVGHLGSIVAAPLAAAQVRGNTTGRQFLCGLAAGLEVCSRIARAVIRDPSPALKPIDLLLEGQLLGYFGAAAACGSIFGLDADKMHSALGLALMQAAGSMQVVFDGDPPAKTIYAAFSNHGGLLAAMLARSGLDAKIAAFEGRAGLFGGQFGRSFDRDILLGELGASYQLRGVAFKPWPSSGVTHPFIEAAQRLGTFEPRDLRQIHLRGGTRAKHWFEPESERRRPASAASAANSVFYSVARTLSGGSLRLDDFGEDVLPKAAPMIDLMSYQLEDALGSSGIVEVVTRAGERRESRVDAPLGTAQRPMSDSQLVDKFKDCARFAPYPVGIESVIDRVFRAETLSSIEDLFQTLNEAR